MVATLRYNPVNRLARTLFMLALLAAVTIVLMVIVTSPHANKHPEASRIRQCLDSNGPLLTYMSPDGSTFFLLCILERGLHGMQIVTRDGYEKTSFIKGDGSLKAFFKYMQRQGAARFTGKLPWLK